MARSLVPVVVTPRRKPSMSTEEILAMFTRDPPPVLMPDGEWKSAPRVPFRADLSHIAVGLWAGYLAVLFLPGRKGSAQITDRHLMQAYGGIMNLWAFVP